ncbi:MAG: hypothetical protein ABI472_07155 [Ginsengibacter sp.]
MKKIFTLLVCTALILSAFAQRNVAYQNQQNYKIRRGNYNNDPRYERDKEIARLNYFNNIRVQQLVNDPCLNIWEKRDAIRTLETQRIQKINTIYQAYNSSVAYYTSNEINNSFEMMYNSNSGYRK